MTFPEQNLWEQQTACPGARRQRSHQGRGPRAESVQRGRPGGRGLHCGGVPQGWFWRGGFDGGISPGLISSPSLHLSLSHRSNARSTRAWWSSRTLIATRSASTTPSWVTSPLLLLLPPLTHIRRDLGAGHVCGAARPERGALVAERCRGLVIALAAPTLTCRMTGLGAQRSAEPAASPQPATQRQLLQLPAAVAHAAAGTPSLPCLFVDCAADLVSFPLLKGATVAGDSNSAANAVQPAKVRGCVAAPKALTRATALHQDGAAALCQAAAHQPHEGGGARRGEAVSRGGSAGSVAR